MSGTTTASTRTSCSRAAARSCSATSTVTASATRSTAPTARSSSANAVRPDQLGQERGTGTPVEGVVTTGVPVKDPKYGTTSKKNGEGICPAAIGFKDQQPSAYSPITGLLLRPDEPHLHGLRGRRGEVHRRSAVRRRDRADVPGPRRPPWPVHRLGSDEGQAWCGRSRRTSRRTAARSTTAGGLVFYGTMEGWLKAVDAKTGKVLWQFKTPSGIIGNPMTYTGPGWPAVRRRATRASVAGPVSAWPRASAPRIRPPVSARSAPSVTRASSQPGRRPDRLRAQERRDAK